MNDTGGARELVADAELVAVDRSGGSNRLRAFQELATRARGQTELHQVCPLPPVLDIKLVPTSLMVAMIASLFNRIGAPCEHS